MYEQKNRPQSTSEYKTTVAKTSQNSQVGVSLAKGPDHNLSTVQMKENKTGLPDNIKSGVESLSGHSLDDVRVHFNSSKPAQLQAHAYTQGAAIHVAPGQEKHLAHEAWHVVQQKQGRVQATTQKQGVSINDNTSLEREADIMGAKALATGRTVQRKSKNIKSAPSLRNGLVQFKGNKGKSKSTKKSGSKSSAPSKSAETPQEIFETQLKASFKSSRGDGASRNVGNGGGGPGTNFIINRTGTRHHIYPKDRLRDPALSVSKALIAYGDAIDKVDSKSATYGKTQFNSLKALGTIVGLNENGSVNNQGNYYWNPGIHFYGVASDYRADDPGSNPEPFKPRSLQQVKFDRPKEFGAAMQSVMNNLNNIGSTGSIDTTVIKDARQKYTNMNKSGHMTTHQLKGDDWTIKSKPSTPAAYNTMWGSERKIYILNRTGGNDYKSYPQSKLDPIETKEGTDVKATFNLSDPQHKIRELSGLTALAVGAAAKAEVEEAMQDIQSAENADKPHEVYNHFRDALRKVRTAKSKVPENLAASLTTFNEAIDQIENELTALSNDRRLDDAVKLSAM